TASVLAIIGGCLMIVAGMIITTLAVFVIPHLNTFMFHNATGSLPVQNVPSFVGSILAGFGLLGLISGIIVLGSGMMLRIEQGEGPDDLKKLKVLLVLLLAATSGLAVSIYLLALIYSPTESPISVLYLSMTRGFPQNLTFFVPLSSLLFLSTVLASMVGVIYF